MKEFILVVVFFLLAFAGLAAGLLMKRRGLRGSCGHSPEKSQECRCETELDSSVRGQCEQQKNSGVSL
jgi:hypothetical protein